VRRKAETVFCTYEMGWLMIDR